MIPSTLYSLSFLIGLSAAAPAADHAYSSKCTTTTHKPTTTCTAGGSKNTHPAPYPSSKKGGYPSEDPYYPEEPTEDYPTEDYPTKGYPTKGYPTKGYATKGYPTKGYPTKGYPTKGYPTKGYPTETSAEYPYETSVYPTYTSTKDYYGGNGTMSVTIRPTAPKTTVYPSVDPFPDSTTTYEEPYPEPTDIIVDPTTTEEPFPEPTDEPLPEPTDEPTPDPIPTGETITAPGPLGDDVTFTLTPGQSIQGSVFDQSEVPQQAIDDGIAIDFCAGACAVSSYLCEGFELFTNEFERLVCTLKFDLAGFADAEEGTVSGVILAQ